MGQTDHNLAEARRLQVPVKDLSNAINQICGENVSRFVNRHRIAHACELLERFLLILNRWGIPTGAIL